MTEPLVRVDDLLKPPTDNTEPFVDVQSLINRTPNLPDQPVIPGAPPRPVVDPERNVSLGATALGSLSSELEPRMRLFARELFPDIPEAEAVKRFGVVEGKIVFRDNDGTIKFAEPEQDLLFGLTTDRAEARSVRAIAPVLGSMIGGIGTLPLVATGPAGLAANVGAAAAGGAAGQGINELIAGMLMGQESDVSDIASRIAFEAGVGGLSEGIGGAFMGVSRNRALGRLRDERKVFQEPEVQQAIRDSEAVGVDLTLAEQSRSRVLIQRQRFLQNHPQTTERFVEQFARRDDQVQQSVYRYLDSLAPEGATANAAAGVRDAAEQAIDAAIEARRVQARPLYQQAFQENPLVDIRPVLAGRGDFKGVLGILEIAGDGGVLQGAMRRVFRLLTEPAEAKLRRELAEGTSNLTPAQVEQAIKELQPGQRVAITNLERLHEAKTEIDTLIASRGPDAPDANTRRILLQTKDHLLTQIREASSAYEAARAIFEEGSPAVTALQRGHIGRLAGLQDTQLNSVRTQLFGPNVGAGTIRDARAVIEASNPEAWRAIVREQLQVSFEKLRDAGVRETGNRGVQFFRREFGSQFARQQWQAALTGPEFRALNKLMQTFERTGVALRGASDTFPFGEVNEEMSSQARGLIGKLAQPQRLPGLIADWVDRARTGRISNQMADVLLDPNGRMRLAEIHQMRPGTAQQAVALMQLLGFTIAPRPEDVVGEPAVPQGNVPIGSVPAL